MNVLHVIPTVHPAYGGPVEALLRSDRAWRRLGHTREVVSLDLPADAWVASCPIPTHPLGSDLVRRWTPRLPILRYGFSPRLVPWLRAHIARFDAAVVHGLWHYAVLAARRVLPTAHIPYFVYTHGMLDPWFRRAHPVKHVGKRLVWWAAEAPLLRGARSVLVTSEAERAVADPDFSLRQFATAVAGYGVTAPPPATPDLEAAFRRRVPGLTEPYLLFLGRIHEKKGIDLLIDAFAAVAARSPDLDLVIAGPDSRGLQPRLHGAAVEAGVAHRMHWPGHLTGDEKWGALYGCEAFVLPSHGENFGMAVVEAMACARPVLVSDRVNIADRILAADAGLVAPDTVEGTTDLLDGFFRRPASEKLAMGVAARACYEQNYDIDRVMSRTAGILSGSAARDDP